ncbi:two-partner secretion domain-containing protein [Rahnella aceris]
MNKGLYRLIFNQARGALIVVAETTKGHDGSRQPRRRLTSGSIVATLRPLSLSMLCALSLISVTPAGAKSHISADQTAPKNQQPQILPAGNNADIPVINIQTPNGKGVSRNTYSRFDVGQDGAVLNNARTQQNSASQIAGYVGANPNLAGGNARVILNEVNTRDPSQLNGYIDIAGQRAQIIIANPSGISCDGCGFINANRTSLVTGKTRFDSAGNITGYSVDEGKVIINGAGLDASQADQTDIIARAVELNAGLWASDLTVTTGANMVEAGDPKHARVQAASATTNAQFTLDVSALGGMYAGKITLTGTEAGVGVRNAGYIGASAGDVIVTASGKIENSGTINATGNITSDAKGELNNSGVLYAQHNVNTSSESVNNSGTLAGSGNLAVQTRGTLTNSNHGILSTDAKLTVNGASIDNAGTITAQNDIFMESDGAVINHNSGQIASNANLSVQGTHLDNKGSIAAQGDISLRPLKGFTNSGVINNSGALLLETPTLANSGSIYSLGTGHYQAVSVNNSGMLASGMALTIDAREQQHDGQVIAGLQTDGSLNDGNLTLTGNTFDTDGKLYAGNNLTLIGNSLRADGQFYAGGNVNISASEQQLAHTQMVTGHDLILSADTLTADGLLYAGNNLTLTGDTVTSAGQLYAGRDASLSAAGLRLAHSQIVAGNDLSLNGNQLDTQFASLQATQDLNARAEHVNNQSGQWVSGDNLCLQAGLLNNQDGSLQAGRDSALQIRHELNNTGGVISTNGVMDLNDNLTNQLTIANTGGILLAASELNIDAYALSGGGDLLSLNSINLTLHTDTEFSGEITANGNATLTFGGNLDNSGLIQAGSILTLSADQINNQNGSTISAGHTDLDTVTLTNRGLIDGVFTDISAGTVNNIGTGRIYGDTVVIDTDTLNNLSEGSDSATLAARQTLVIGAKEIHNRAHSLIYSEGDMIIGGRPDPVTGLPDGRATLIDNASATLESQGNMWLSAQTINNLNLDFTTHMVVVDSHDVTEYAFFSDAGTRYGPDIAYVDDQSSDGLNTLHLNDGSEKRSDHYYDYEYTHTVTDEQILTSDPGQILAGGDLTIDAETVFNDKSEIIAGGNLLVHTDNALINTIIMGTEIQDDHGTVTEFYREKRKGNDKQKRDQSVYNQTAISQIDLGATVYQSQTAPANSGISLAGNTIIYVDSNTGVDTDHTINAPAGTGNIHISTVTPSVPDTSSLLQPASSDTAGYYLEVDPQFANYRTWLSSDYMLQQMRLDPNDVQKRLGDGFTEQRMVREQVVQLTGQRFLDGYSSDEEQYMALLDNGIAFGDAYNLIPGVALSAEQMSYLTRDMVWLVEQTVTLPDGTQTTALVPQVYVVGDNTQTPSASLIAGRNVSLDINGQLSNSGTINAANNLLVNSDSLTNSGNLFANNIGIQALGDISHLGGLIEGKNSVALLAGGNINVASQTRRTDTTQGISRTAAISVTSTGISGGTSTDGTLIVNAGNDINLTAASLSNEAGDGNTLINAGGDINLNTATIGFKQDINFGGDHYLNYASSTEAGTRLATAGNLIMTAGDDISARAAAISTGGDLALNASGDIVVEAGRSISHVDNAGTIKGRSGLINKTSTTERYVTDKDMATGSALVSGGETRINAGNNLTIGGSTLAGVGDIRLAAQNDINVVAVEQTAHSDHQLDVRERGIFTSGASIMMGKTETASASTTDSLTHRGSVVASDGNITIDAGGTYNQIGSGMATIMGGDTLHAGQDIAITAGDIRMSAAENHVSKQDHTMTKTQGLTIGLSGAIPDALVNMNNMNNAAHSSDSKTMKALAGGAAVLGGVNSYGKMDWGLAETLFAESGINAMGAASGGIKANITYGGSRQDSLTLTEKTSYAANTISAGDDISLVARNDTTHHGSGDIHIQGSDVSAAGDISLDAERNIDVHALNSTTVTANETNISSWGAGAGISLSKDGWAAGFTANGKLADVTMDMQNSNWQNSHLSAGENLVIRSGGDTTLSGATAGGQRITADIGGNLDITSLQNSLLYDNTRQGGGGSITVGYGVAGGGSVNRTNISADHAAVAEQSGLIAGDGGFNVNVKDNTRLDGAIIASSDAAVENGKNTFSSGTLETHDIANHSDYGASKIGIGGNAAKGAPSIPFSATERDKKSKNNTSPPFMPFVGLPTILFMGENSSSMTRSAISGGTITLTDVAGQQAQTGQSTAQTIGNLNRDTTHSSGILTPVFDPANDAKRINNNFTIESAIMDQLNSALQKQQQDAMKAKAAAAKRNQQ